MYTGLSTSSICFFKFIEYTVIYKGTSRDRLLDLPLRAALLFAVEGGTECIELRATHGSGLRFDR